MVRFFKKKEEQAQLTRSEIDELVKSSYKLGFEVGYHKHSELGWVSEQYSMLEDLARESGLGKLVMQNYRDGKEYGFKARERDLKIDNSKRSSEKRSERMNLLSDPAEYNLKHSIEAGYKSQRTADENTAGLIQQPSITDLPGSTSRTAAIDRPSQIKGFKALTPKN
jgi:hypothetical protein